MVSRGRTRSALPNDLGPGSAFAKRHAPSFVGFSRTRHGGSLARDARDDLDKPLMRISIETSRLSAKKSAESRVGLLPDSRTHLHEPTGVGRRCHHHAIVVPR